ncbi:AraC family transcriptional regulator [Nostoc sp. XA013]|nr:AraC family transcriptional regulator [Nostoc sp. XA013]
MQGSRGEICTSSFTPAPPHPAQELATTQSLCGEVLAAKFQINAIADIVLQVGFSSQSHLTQQFKRITGMTPRQVR